MKLLLIFLLIDGAILLAYPLLYVANIVRRFFKFKR
jgi:hypothetical protein